MPWGFLRAGLTCAVIRNVSRLSAMTALSDFQNVELFGVGSYTVREAARLLHTSSINISRWMKGYNYRRKGVVHEIPPLWPSQWLAIADDNHMEIGFRDLVELRFVKAFTEAGVGLLAVRNCMAFARELVRDAHPFSTRRFRTDGKTIFLESALQQEAQSQLLDLKQRQYVFGQVIERTFKDLDIEADAVARWRPFKGKKSIVIDPHRSFGQPILADFGVPTIALAEAVDAEGSPERVAQLYEVTLTAVRDAVRFEHTLRAA